jgi:signal transduction histidine kinase
MNAVADDARLKMLDQLGRSLAHDLNNVLTVSKGYGEMLLEDLPPEHVTHRFAQEIVEAIDRATQMVRQFHGILREGSDDLPTLGWESQS